MKKIFVSDVTLRMESEVLKKVLSFRERLNIAVGLEKAGVDTVELPAIQGGKEDMVVCRTIANTLKCGVAIPVSTVAAVEEAWKCISDAANPCIQVVLPVSTVQMEYMYHLKSEKMLGRIAEICAKAKELCPRVEFIARDASRAEAGFAAACCKIAAENGADAVTVCDDSSCFFPEEMAALVQEVCGVCQVPVYIQPGNGLNMAAACAVEAIRAGAAGVKTAACADCLPADVFADLIRARGDALQISCGLDTTAIHNIIASLGQNRIPVASAAAPAATDVLSLDPDCTLSDISGVIGSLGYELSEEDVGKVYEEFRRVSALKGKLESRELEAIIATSAMQVPSTFHLSSYVVNSGNIITATAHVTLEKDGQKLSGVSVGDGPIDAAFHAIEQIIGHHYELDDFQIQSVTKGREAVGSSLIRLRANGKLYSGNGASTDIVGACIRAYINALNKIVYEG